MNLESPKKRLIVGIILLLALAGLCTYYAAEYENHLKYPSYGAILSYYPQGEVVDVYGTVIKVDSDSFHIQENYHGHIVTIKVLNSNPEFKDTPLVVNDKVSLLGVLGPDNQIVNIQQMEINEYTNYIFLLLRSFVAMFFLIYIFNRYWHFNWETFQFRRR